MCVDVLGSQLKGAMEVQRPNSLLVTGGLTHKMGRLNQGEKTQQPSTGIKLHPCQCRKT